MPNLLSAFVPPASEAVEDYESKKEALGKTTQSLNEVNSYLDLTDLDNIKAGTKLADEVTFNFRIGQFILFRIRKRFIAFRRFRIIHFIHLANDGIVFLQEVLNNIVNTFRIPSGRKRY